MFGIQLLNRVLTSILKQHPNSRLSRVLLRDIDARDGTPTGTLTRADRLWRALKATAAAALCFVGAVGASSLSDRFPDSSGSSKLFIGVGLFALMLAFVALGLAVRDLVKAPLSPSSESWSPLTRNSLGRAKTLAMSPPPGPLRRRAHGGMSLHEACYQGRVEVVAQLLESGADPNESADPSERGWVSCAGSSPKPLNCVAIAWTMTEKHVEIARLLIEAGAVVDDSVLRDHAIEMVGNIADWALQRLLDAACGR